MPGKARRPSSRPRRGRTRRALLPVCLWLAALGAVPAAAAEIESASYAEPTRRYPHGALGDDVEHAALRVVLAGGRVLTARFAGEIVFEDTEPRLVDLTGDGAPEIVAVESHESQGARLTVWGLDEGRLVRLAATPFIGRRFRWLAPVGAADLDGDGRMEIAYVETPHLGKVLKIVRIEGDRLAPVAEARGLTNHRIGEPFIEGRIATCDGSPTILTADAGWKRIMATVLDAGTLASRDLAPYAGPDSFADLPGCR